MPRSKHGELYRVLGLRLQRARNACGFTQRDVDAKLGYRQDMVSRMETADRRVDVFELIDLATLYGVPLADFIKPPTPAELAHKRHVRDRRSPS